MVEKIFQQIQVKFLLVMVMLMMNYLKSICQISNKKIPLILVNTEIIILHLLTLIILLNLIAINLYLRVKDENKVVPGFNFNTINRKSNYKKRKSFNCMWSNWNKPITN